jgi:glycosyltransferase involved in cell wall biosynthesis
MKEFEVSVIISTYNQPEWLQKVLWSYEQQRFKDFEIIIADDGSGQETKDLIDDFKKNSELAIKHVWQEDKGFRKTKILNKAILKSSSDYLIFTDGDCIVRSNFVETHLTLRKHGYALSGGYFKLTKQLSQAITFEDIITQQCFKKSWLLKMGQPRSFKMHKLSNSAWKSWLLNTFTTTKATFDGMNVSAWYKDLLAVNGFDERMEYGGEDREIGERMINYGIRFKQIRYSAICLHLHHERPYKNLERLIRNKEIRSITKREKRKSTKFGIVKSTQE